MNIAHHNYITFIKYINIVFSTENIRGRGVFCGLQSSNQVSVTVLIHNEKHMGRNIIVYTQYISYTTSLHTTCKDIRLYTSCY